MVFVPRIRSVFLEQLPIALFSDTLLAFSLTSGRLPTFYRRMAHIKEGQIPQKGPNPLRFRLVLECLDKTLYLLSREEVED